MKFVDHEWEVELAYHVAIPTKELSRNSWGFRWSPVGPCVQLRNALALCHILNRTLVLPSLTSGAEQWWNVGNQGAVRSTPADFVLDLER